MKILGFLILMINLSFSAFAQDDPQGEWRTLCKRNAIMDFKFTADQLFFEKKQYFDNYCYVEKKRTSYEGSFELIKVLSPDTSIYRFLTQVNGASRKLFFRIHRGKYAISFLGFGEYQWEVETTSGGDALYRLDRWQEIMNETWDRLPPESALILEGGYVRIYPNNRCRAKVIRGLPSNGSQEVWIKLIGGSCRDSVMRFFCEKNESHCMGYGDYYLSQKSSTAFSVTWAFDDSGGMSFELEN